MSMLRDFDSSSSGVTSGNDSGVYTGASGPFATANGGDSARRVQYRHQSGGVLLDHSSLLSKRPSPGFVYTGPRKQARNDHAAWISGYSDQSTACHSRGACEESVRSRLQELERALLDDDDHGDGGLGSEIIDGNDDWMETMQNLISSGSCPLSPPPAFSQSPPSACSSTSSTPVEPKQLVLNSLVALSEGRIDHAIGGLSQARQLCNPRSSDPEQRLVSQITRSIALRSCPAEVRPPGATMLSSPEHLLSVQKLLEASPCFKLGFVAANLAILDAVRSWRKLHVIDFDIGQGAQYASLIHDLAAERSKSGRLVSLRITAAVIENTGSGGAWVVGERLEKLAERIGVRCSFQVVNGRRIGELNRTQLGCSDSEAEDEAVVVNLAYRLYRVADESVTTENPRDEMLRVAKGLRPVVVTVVEQVMNGNTTPLEPRFREVVEYYKALMESMDATMGSSGPGEKEAADECLGRRAANAVACEGRERVERCEVAGKWAARLGMAGFQPRPLGPNVHAIVSTKLRSYRKPDVTLKEEAGGLCFGWKDRVLTYASAWH